MSDDVKDVLHVKELIANAITLDAITVIDSSGQVANNGTETVTISNVAPAAVGTPTISKWLKIIVGGTDFYIPMWT